MAARAMWKGTLIIGREKVGIRLFAAVNDQAVHFNLLHEKDGERVRQRMAHPETGETVAADEAQRGYEVEPGRFVLLDDEDLAAVEPKATRDVQIDRFVPPALLDPRWYERPYWLGPEAADARRYAALAEALAASGLEGIAHWTMRKREYHGALRVHDGRLALIALHSVEEVVPAEGFQAPEGRALESKERDLAKQLVEALSGEFRHDEFADEYRERVLEIVEAKRKGKRVAKRKVTPRRVSGDALVGVLQRSLKKAG